MGHRRGEPQLYQARIVSKKLNLRDLLWLTLVTAVALAWFASHRRQAAEWFEARLRLTEWRDATADLLLRTGVAVRYIEPLTAEEALFAAEPNRGKLSSGSVKNLPLLDELGTMAIRLIDKPASPSAQGPN